MQPCFLRRGSNGHLNFLDSRAHRQVPPTFHPLDAPDLSFFHVVPLTLWLDFINSVAEMMLVNSLIVCVRSIYVSLKRRIPGCINTHYWHHLNF